MVTATMSAVRVMGVWVRRVDAGLVDGAARNAGTAVAADRERALERDTALAALDESAARRSARLPRQTA